MDASDRLMVVAFNKGSSYWYYVILLAGETTFSISNLPAGRYQVIAGQNTSADVNEWGAS